MAMKALTLALMVSLAGCATSQPQLWSDEDEPALLYAGTDFELRVRDGRVEQVLLPRYPGGPTEVRAVRDVEELRRVYALAGVPLGDSGTTRTISVNGWYGLACLRVGEACGPAPADLVPAMIVLRLD